VTDYELNALDFIKRLFTIRDGKAYGLGVIDMKGGIVVLTYAIKALKSINYKNRTLKIILLGDEEIAHHFLKEQKS